MGNLVLTLGYSADIPRRMDKQEYVVIYEVAGFGQRTAGPYPSWEVAVEHRDDIAGFDGVSNAFIAEQPKENA